MGAPQRAAAPAAPGYRRIFAVPGFPSLVGASLLARTGQQMSTVALVLFVLARGGSGGLAGTVVFLLLGPGLAISPIAGALLDRHGRIRLVTVDYLVAAVALALLVVLDAAGGLPAVALCLIVGAGSLTYPLSNSGTRSLFPLVLPEELWDRANALDSGMYVVAMIAGPAIAGAAVAISGTRAALVVDAAVYLAAAVAVRTATEPRVTSERRPLLQDARAGIAYVVRSRSLRSLALCLSVYNVGSGMVVVALPLLVIQRFGGGGEEVGALFALQGVGGVAGALAAAAIGSQEREREHVAGGMILSVVALALVATANAPWQAALGMLVLGASNGPIDIGLFGLRQRRTERAWVGRVFAISMAFNFCGYPIGSLLGGPVAGRAPGIAFVVAAVAAAGGAAIAWGGIPAEPEPPPQIG
ncbi:MAG TPA: MFS transporter [Candidatus Dormibacteraeota bacterium]|nr:MFS transporter [Candidatus Dormibacteraeota bacterium]